LAGRVLLKIVCLLVRRILGLAVLGVTVAPSTV
jgi:hypothetical protein